MFVGGGSGSGSEGGADDADDTDDAMTEASSDDGTTGGLDATDSGSTDAGVPVEDSTGEPVEHRIVVFRGPEFTGSAVADVGAMTFNFAANECREHYNEFHGDIDCPGGQVWGLLGSGGNQLGDYPSRPSGGFLDGAPVLAADETTLIADGYGELIAGDLAVPMVGNAIEGAGVEVLWWGESSMGDPGSNCQNWSVGGPGALGAAIIVDDANPFFGYEGMPCDQALPILCICF